MNKNFIRRLSKDTFDRKQDTLSAEAGVLGDFNQAVNVPGRSSYVYVRLINRVVECYNNRVPPVLDLPVLIGYDPLQPSLYQVLSQRGGGAESYGNSPSDNPYLVAPHHQTHEWLGSDTTFINIRQYLPLRVAAAGDITVSVWPGFYSLDTVIGYIAAETLDLSIYIPSYNETTGDPQSKFVLIVIRAGALFVIDGTPHALNDLVIPDDFPAMQATDILLAAVRLWSDQLEIVETTQDTDIIDLRMAYLGSGDMLKSVYDTDNDGAVNEAEHAATADAATTAASAAIADDLDIPGLAAITSMASGDLLVIDRAGVRKKIDIDNFSTDVLTGKIEIGFDGHGDVPAPGLLAVDLVVPFDLTVTGWTIFANLNGSSLVFDLWKDTYANYPPTVADTITASNKPTLTTARTSTGDVTGWTTAWTAGDIILINIDSISTATAGTLVIDYTRS